MNQEDPALDSLRRSLERTEADLRDLGYAIHRCVVPPGARLSDQIFNGETLILVLFGRIQVRSNEEVAAPGAGGRIQVPAGVPYTIRVVRETPAYWLQAKRPERPGDAAAGGEADG